MYITPCPQCGKMPKITLALQNHKTREMRRMIHCPKYCSVLKPKYEHLYPSGSIIVEGNYDDNALYKIWNNSLINTGE